MDVSEEKFGTENPRLRLGLSKFAFLIGNWLSTVRRCFWSDPAG